MSFRLVEKTPQPPLPNLDELERLYTDLVNLLNEDSDRKVLVSFESRRALQYARRCLLEWASEEDYLLYEEPIAGTLDTEFYLERDSDDQPVSRTVS